MGIAVMAEKKEKDDLSSVSQRLAKQVTDNAGKIRNIIIAVVIVVVAFVAVFLIMRRNASESLAASERALFQAQVDTYTKPENDAMATFAAVAREYSGSAAADSARVYQFAVALKDNDFDAAEKAAREFIKQNPTHAFAPRMRLALGQLLLNINRVDEAKAEIEPLSKLGGATQPEAAITIAQIYEREADKLEGPAREQKLIEAQNAYTNIMAQSQNRFSYWPQSVVLAAEFSLLAVNDKLQGYTHPEPKVMPPAAVGASLPEGLSVDIMPAPPSETDDLSDASDDDLVDVEENAAQ